MKTHNHSHDHEGHEGGHTPSLRPVTGLEQRDIQPRGNSAQQEALSSSEDWCPDYVQDVCDMGMDVWQWAFGEDWWADFKAAKTSERQTKALEAWQSNTLQDYIDELDTGQMVDPAQYRDELGEVLDYLQQFEMMRAAGMTWEQMATAQKDWMVAEATAAAKQARAEESTESDSSTVSDAEIIAAQQEAVADQSYNTHTPADQTQWAGFSPTQRQSWLDRADRAIDVFIAWAKVNHPELNIKDGEIIEALEECERENAVAYVNSTGNCYISMEVVVAIERDPAYALSTIQHELRGHPEFDTGFNVGMELYDAAAAEMPGYTQPANNSDERYAEWSRYEYYGSEIGALMREEAFWHYSRDIDGDGNIADNELNPLGNPIGLLDMLLDDMKTNWEPAILQAYVTSMAKRFKADPRITDNALQSFEAACVQNLGIAP
jgi:hypothetical protein